MGLKSLAEKHDKATCREFLDFVLHDKATDDARVFYNEWVHSVKSAARKIGSDRPTVIQDWVAEVTRLSESHSEELEELPRIDGEIKLVRLSKETRSLEYSFQSTPPPQDGWFELRHVILEPFETEIDDYAVVNEKFLFENDADGESYETFSRGDRFAWTIVVDVERLGCEVITGWKYQEVE